MPYHDFLPSDLDLAGWPNLKKNCPRLWLLKQRGYLLLLFTYGCHRRAMLSFWQLWLFIVADVQRPQTEFIFQRSNSQDAHGLAKVSFVLTFISHFMYLLLQMICSGHLMTDLVVICLCHAACTFADFNNMSEWCHLLSLMNWITSF